MYRIYRAIFVIVIVFNPCFGSERQSASLADWGSWASVDSLDALDSSMWGMEMEVAHFQNRHYGDEPFDLELDEDRNSSLQGVTVGEDPLLENTTALDPVHRRDSSGSLEEPVEGAEVAEVRSSEGDVVMEDEPETLTQSQLLEQQIDVLNNSICNLERNRTYLEAVYDRRWNSLFYLRAERQSALPFINNLQTQLFHMVRKIDALRVSIFRLHQSNENISRGLRFLPGAIDYSVRVLSGLRHQFEELGSRLLELEAELEDGIQLRDRFRLMCEIALARLRGHYNALRALEADISDLPSSQISSGDFQVAAETLNGGSGCAEEDAPMGRLEENLEGTVRLITAAQEALTEFFLYLRGENRTTENWVHWLRNFCDGRSSELHRQANRIRELAREVKTFATLIESAQEYVLVVDLRS